jgi:glycosyltransferase involved in cell wall biosynthesis
MQDVLPDEILLLDDGSTDETGAICDQLASDHSLIRVVHQPNIGIASERNAAVELCKSTHLMFVDSDDVLFSTTIANIWKRLKKENPEVIFFNFENVTDADAEGVAERRNQFDDVVSGPEALDRLLTNQLTHYPWQFVAKKSVYTTNQILFPDGQLFEDYATTYQILYCSGKVAFISSPMYKYVNTNKSIIHSWRELHLESILNLTNDIIQNLKIWLPTEKMDECYSYCLPRIFLGYKWAIRQDSRLISEYEVMLSEILKAVHKVNSVDRKTLLKIFLVKVHVFKPLIKFNLKLKG